MLITVTWQSNPRVPVSNFHVKVAGDATYTQLKDGAFDRVTTYLT